MVNNNTGRTYFKKGHRINNGRIPWNKGKTHKIEKICPYCKSKFLTYISRFCSRKCGYLNRRGIPCSDEAKIKLSKANFKGGCVTSQGYRVFSKEGKLVLEHRVIWERAFGKISEGLILHHKDGNKLNNSLDNLQLMTRSEHRRIHAEN